MPGTIGPEDLRRRNAFFGAALLLLALAVHAAAFKQEADSDVPSALGPLLEKLAPFEYGADDAPLLALRAYVRARRNDPPAMSACESAFLDFLQGDATQAAKQAVCRELSLIGTDGSVPVLERMLAVEGTSDMARYALEAIPGPAADGALLRALDALGGNARLGIFSSLGNRRCAAAVPALDKDLRSSDRNVAVVAAEALGRIGGPDATAALTRAVSKARPSVREPAAAALLACAERYLARGNAPEALAAFNTVLTAGPNATLRRAAFRGAIAASPVEGKALILGALGGKPPDMVQPAIDMIPIVFDTTTISAAADLLHRLSENGQIQLVAAMALFPTGSVRAALTKASAGPFTAVRIEALWALGKAGDGSVVPLLAARAVTAAGGEREAARESLGRLIGADVDKAVLDGIAGPGPEAVRLELIRAIGERGVPRGKEVLLGLARADRPAIRLAAVRAFGRLAGAEDLIALLDLLSEAGDGTEQEEIGSVIVSAALEHARPDERASAVAARLAAEEDPGKRAALLRVLGGIGEDRTLPVVREALADASSLIVDAAVRAIAGWPTAVARDDALRIARGPESLVHRVLALEGFVRMVGLEPYRAPEGAVASLRDALAVAERPEERRLVLAALPSFPCPDGLALAEELAGAPDIGSEARVAAEAIRKEIAARKR